MTQLVEPHLSVREIERAILREAAGCGDEDDRNVTYAVANAPVTMLHRRALAQKLLKGWLVNLGFDPSIRNQYGVDSKHDWDEDRSLVSREDPLYDKKMARIAREEAEEAAALAQVDHEAWEMIHRWEAVIGRRAYALEKLDLVDCDVTGMSPNEVSVPFPDTLDTGWEGTIQITEAGRKFLASGKTLREVRGQNGVDPLDRELEVTEDAKSGVRQFLGRIFS